MATPDPDPLSRYWAKRDFAITSEPRGEPGASGAGRSFVIQKHAASRLHYDFRLELDGVLVSWALPKGPSFDPADKRMAIHVEDHPLSYGSFEGTIPPKQYGAGTVIVWDNGIWEPVGDPREGLAKGKLLFHLHGQKLHGLWELVKIAKGGEKQEPWILFKKRDASARPKAEFDVVTALPDSVFAKPLKPAKPPKVAGESEPPPRRRKGAAGAGNEPRHTVPGAVKAPMPKRLAPQLATLATGVPTTGSWSYEIKFDGYRMMARIEGGKAQLFTRNGHDWSAKMPGVIADLEGLGVQTAWLDGEVVVLGANGAPDFNALQNAFDKRSTGRGVVFFVFDVPYFEGYDLREVELASRRSLLKSFFEEKATDVLRFSADFDADPASILASACKLELEGLIAKRTDAPYVSRRADTWLKLKCKLRQEFVVCGFTARSDNASVVGSLLLGIHDGAGKLISAGTVGTGWGAAEGQAMMKKLTALEVQQPPFEAGSAKKGRWSKRSAGGERWTRPELVAEVTFQEWTPDGQIRHASFVGLRTDKPARMIIRERAADGVDQAPAEPPRRPTAAAVKVSNADRVIDPASGLTKLDLVRYYESVAEWMLPHLKNRPCSLVRGPIGVTGQLFFQKHAEKTSMPGIRELSTELWPGHDALLEVGTVQALAGAAQMNVIEFHTWNSTAKAIDKPDRMIFDLDPGEGTTWAHIQEAAVLMRAMLTELGLESWLKTSGGKGLHVVVPLAPRLGYPAVKGFSEAIVRHMARTIPSRFVAKSGPSNRIGKLFIDYLRNGHGATTAAAFSARARPGLGVSMPISWDQLSEIKSGAQWTVGTAREYLSFQTADPWAAYWKARQPLGVAMKKLGFQG